MRPEIDDDFGRYVAARQHGFLRAAFLVCGDRDRAEDVVEAAFARLAPRWSRLRGEEPDAYVRAHLYRAAVAAARKSGGVTMDGTPTDDQDRAASGDAEQGWGTEDDTWGSDDAGFGDGGWSARTEWHDPADHGRDPRLEAALARLAPRERALLVLQFFEDRSPHESAAALGLGPDKAAALTRSALADLAENVPGLTAQDERR